MVALKKTYVAVPAETGAFAGENVGLFSSTCLGGEHAGSQVSLYSSTCISESQSDMHSGDATQMVSSTCLETAK
ncbi:hypothetical protein FGE21_08765 [Phaeobacter sp. B1627]|nr:hypothetical protein FGE21_08765 [Phaeobacter sp. B1627]